MSTVYSALIRPPKDLDLLKWFSAHIEWLRLPPDRTGPQRRSVLPFGHDELVVLIITHDAVLARRLLEEALGPDGELLAGPLAAQVAVQVAR